MAGTIKQKKLSDSRKSELKDFQKTPVDLTPNGVKSSNLSIEKLRTEKNKRRKLRAKRGERKHKGEPDWSLLEDAKSAKSPVVSFSPTAAKRREMLDVLQRKPADPERRLLVRTLEREFIRIYKRYRRHYHPTYILLEGENKHASKAAVACITRGVSARELIEYWHEHVGDFTGMKLPTLAFLSNPSNVDQVAVQQSAGSRRTGKALKQRSVPAPAPKVHAFDEHELHPEIRPGLLEAGFDVRQLNDRYLVNIQQMAKALATGHPMFISQKLKPLVDWVKEHVYANG